jgi:carbon-monoxide dehydrogenase large subunit
MKTYRGRKEDPRLLTGQGRYTGDCTLPGELHAHFLRTDRAHAIIHALDVSAAKAAPGVRRVLVGRDILGAGFHTLPSLVAYPGRGGMKLRLPERLPLALERVRYVGEAVALVIADSLPAAMDASELIAVEYQDLPAVIGVERALEADALQIHEAIPGNVCFDFEYGDERSAAEAFARADRVVRVVIESPRVAPSPMEPRAVLADWDAASERYVIRCPNQGAFMVRDALAGMLGVDASHVRVEGVDVGGAFGARVSPYYEYAILLHAARLLERPVKWTSTRSDDFTNDGHGRAVRLTGELALDRSGRFLALRTLWLADSGAYLCQAGALTNTGNNKTIGAGPYRVDALYSRHLQIVTNTTPTEAFRGAGRPEAAYVVERLVDEAAVQLGIDALELRRRNALPRGAMPYTTHSGTVFDSADFHALLEAAEAESRWRDFASRRAEAVRRGRLRGIGCALFIEPSGGGGVPRDQVALRFVKSERGESQLELFMVAGSSGQGHETVFPELVGERLGIDAAGIVLRAGDPDGPALMGAASIGSRTALSQGSAFSIAADEVIRKGLDLAADALEAPRSDIEFRDGRYVVKGTDRAVALTVLVERHRSGSAAHPLDTLAENPAARAFPSGAHVCEVEIDPETGEAQIIAYTAVDDLGRALNLTLAEGQIVGGVVQSAGHVFGERCLYDAQSGQLLTGSFMDYPLPRADLVLEFRLMDRSVPSPNNPLGAKGAGEAGTTGGLPACMSAVMDALRSAGVHEFDMPATPERLWRALRNQGRVQR